MRKLLMASVATMGALLAATGGAKAQPLPAKIPAPGTIVVHVNGYLQFGLDFYGSTYNTVTAAGVTSKLNSVTANGEFRIYPGFDAQTVSGIDYGVQVELRTTYSDSGEGPNKTSDTSVSANAGTNSLYIRRAYGYLGMPDTGYVRFGQTDSAFTLLQAGAGPSLEAFGDGAQWTGEGTPLQVLPTSATPGTFAFADTGALYGTNKIVLISPAYVEPLLGGSFTADAGFEPNSNGFDAGYADNKTASTTSAALSSIGVFTSTNAKERKNTVDAAVMYALKANGFATKAAAGFLYGSPISFTGAALSSTPNTATNAFHLDSLEVFEAGAQTTYAGITVGANVKAGQTLDSYAPKPKGARDGLTYSVSALYVLGPYVVGGSFYDGQTAGSFYAGRTGEARTLSEYGVAAGGNYVIGKDLSLFVQYLYGHSHEPGAFATSAGVAGKENNTQVQVIATGATFKW